MPTRVPWSRDELLVAFRLYCRTFGRRQAPPPAHPPTRFAPDPAALAWHRERVFR